jgi:hypothetical protein
MFRPHSAIISQDDGETILAGVNTPDDDGRMRPKLVVLNVALISLIKTRFGLSRPSSLKVTVKQF